MKKYDITPDFVAGHSLGEYSALVAAGALSFEDGVMLLENAGNLWKKQFQVAKEQWQLF